MNYDQVMKAMGRGNKYLMNKNTKNWKEVIYRLFQKYI